MSITKKELIELKQELIDIGFKPANKSKPTTDEKIAYLNHRLDEKVDEVFGTIDALIQKEIEKSKAREK